MKNKNTSLITVILIEVFLLLAQYGCRKKEDKYPNLIVGCWNIRSGDFNLFSAGSRTLRFNNDNTYVYYDSGYSKCESAGIMFGPYSYHIKEDTIFRMGGGQVQRDTLLILKMKTNLLHEFIMEVRYIYNGQPYGKTIKYLKCRKCD